MNCSFLRFVRDAGLLAKKYDNIALVGNETFFKDEAARSWLKWTKENATCDEVQYDGHATKLADLEESLNEYPLIGHFRLVQVHNTDHVKKWESLKDWVADPMPGVKAIFHFSEKLPDLPKEWANIHLKVVCNDMGPDSQEFQKYIDYCLEDTEKTADVETRQIIANTFGNNLAYMKHELRKAAYYDRKTKELTPAQLTKALAAYPLAQIFDLVDAIVRRARTQALRLKQDILDQGTEPTQITHLVAQRLKVIQDAIRAQAYGERLKDYMIRKKIPLFQYGAILHGVKTLRESQINEFFDTICETEFRLRSFAEGRTEIERMILNMCR